MRDRRGPLDPVECVLCLVHGRLQQVGGSLELEARVLARAAELVARWTSRTEVFVESYGYVEGLLGVRDYYRERKRELNESALAHLGGAELPSGLVELLGFMAAANGIDIPMPGYTPGVGKLLSGLSEQPSLHGVDWRKVRGWFSSAERLVVVLDNAGEAVFDIAAAARLAGSHGLSLVLIARSEPYEIDVTLGEASWIASRLRVRAQVVGTGSRYPVFHPRASREARDLVDSPSSVVVVKGIANLEAYMDYWSRFHNNKMVFALRAKCNPLARFFDVALEEPVLATADWVKERLADWSSSTTLPTPR